MSAEHKPDWGHILRWAALLGTIATLLVCAVTATAKHFDAIGRIKIVELDSLTAKSAVSGLLITSQALSMQVDRTSRAVESLTRDKEEIRTDIADLRVEQIEAHRTLDKILNLHEIWFREQFGKEPPVGKLGLP